MRVRRLAAAALVCALVVAAAPSSAYPLPGRTELLSASADGVVANSWSTDTAVSADGRYVGFRSSANNLVPGASGAQVYWRDRHTGEIELMSVNRDGQRGDGPSWDPAISADGQVVAFHSNADNLVPDDTNGWWDVFVHDRNTGGTERVSVSSDGEEGNNPSLYPSVSGDGRYVAFHSWADNLVPADFNQARDVFVHDRQTGETERVSLNNDGVEGNQRSIHPSISADGRYVAFFSRAQNLVPGDISGHFDVFVRDRQTGTTEKASVNSRGGHGNRASEEPSISADGRYVAFQSEATNLVPGTSNGVWDIFVHDRETGGTERVSVASDGSEADGWSRNPSISADGRHVAFDSRATNLAAGITNGVWDAFVHDRHSGQTQRVSVTSDGQEAGHEGVPSPGPFGDTYPSISGDGRLVVFESRANDLDPAAANGTYSIFARDQGPALGVGGVSASPSGEELSVSGWARFAGVTVSADDGLSGEAHELARDVGAELAGATVTARPEEEDVLVRLLLTDLPTRVYPGVLYGFGFTTGGQAYEVRAMRQALTGPEPGEAAIALYRCDAGDCEPVAALGGGLGATGHEVRFSVPLAAIDAEPGGTLSGLRAFTALGEMLTGGAVLLDELDLPDAELPVTTVTLGLASDETIESDVAFDIAAALEDGRFTATIDSWQPEQVLWARVCLGGECPATVTSLDSRR